MESKDTDKAITSGRLQPGEDTFEDTAAHSLKSHALAEDHDEDTEGHGTLRGG